MFAAFAVLATSAAAQQGLPHKLVITYSPGGVVVVDYPSRARCEQARQVLEQDTKDRAREARENAPSGAVVVGKPYHLRGVCLPG
jgi:hypothetical protein